MTVEAQFSLVIFNLFLFSEVFTCDEIIFSHNPSLTIIPVRSEFSSLCLILMSQSQEQLISPEHLVW